MHVGVGVGVGSGWIAWGGGVVARHDGYMLRDGGRGVAWVAMGG